MRGAPDHQASQQPTVGADRPNDRAMFPRQSASSPIRKVGGEVRNALPAIASYSQSRLALTRSFFQTARSGTPDMNDPFTNHDYSRNRQCQDQLVQNLLVHALVEDISIVSPFGMDLTDVPADSIRLEMDYFFHRNTSADLYIAYHAEQAFEFLILVDCSERYWNSDEGCWNCNMDRIQKCIDWTANHENRSVILLASDWNLEANRPLVDKAHYQGMKIELFSYEDLHRRLMASSGSAADILRSHLRPFD